VIGSGKQRLSSGRVRNMLADEASIIPIPTGREEPSSNTPNVCKILGRWG